MILASGRNAEFGPKMHGAARPTLWGRMRLRYLANHLLEEDAAGEAALVMKRSSTKEKN